jgi:D-arabinono-1,4-lactone oxidase
MNDALRALRVWYKTSSHKPHYPFILRCTGKSQAFLSGSYGREVCWIGFLVYLAKDGSFVKGSLEMM